MLIDQLLPDYDVVERHDRPPLRSSMSMPTMPRIAALVVLFVAAPQAMAPREVAAQQTPAVRPASRAAADSRFGALVERLSEPGGYFDTDNIISNETSYLHVLGTMRRLGVAGGAYVGVGPDQNFSYIAHVRPSVAFIIDIRRDNLLHHLLFKSLFVRSRNRLEYLCRLFARPMPRNLSQWDQRSIDELVAYIDKTPARPELVTEAIAAAKSNVVGFGLALSDRDIETLGKIHATFISSGLDLRFSSLGRPPRAYYPTFRQLLLERDLGGLQANYLASENDFRFIKSLQERDLVVPVVGDFAGDHALHAIGREIDRRGEHLSVFYASNVEYYLMREGTFDKFVENVRQIPRDERTVVIRSYFGGVYGSPHPQSVRGYYNTQLAQTLDSMVEEYAQGGYRSYIDIVTKHILDR